MRICYVNMVIDLIWRRKKRRKSSNWRKSISRESYRHVFPMPKIIWSLLRGMPLTKRLMKAIWPLKCLLSVIFIPVTGRDAAGPGQWTSMICWCILISCSVISRMCWRVIVISSVMCWWTSIKIRTMRSTALSCNWRRKTSVSAW